MNREERRKAMKLMKVKSAWELLQTDAPKGVDFSGNKAMLNVNKIKKRKKELSQKYLNFIEENKNKKFTIKSYNGNTDMYTLGEDCVYTFHISDLNILGVD